MRKDAKRAEKKIELMLQTIGKLRQHIKQQDEALRQLRMVSDSLMISVILKEGEAVEEDGKVIGYRYTLPNEDVEEVLKKHSLKAEKEDDHLVLGVIVKE